MAKNKNSSCIVSIGTAIPHYTYEQREIADFMIRYFGLEGEAARKVSVIYQKSGIDVRHSVLSDFKLNGSTMLFKSAEKNPSLTQRMNVYKQEAVTLASSAVDDCSRQISRKAKEKIFPVTHLITVSCTGMSAPGLDIQLMQELKLPVDVHRTSVNFMGCYAGFHAFRMADSICKADEDATVLVVLVELCSLHFQPGIESETLVVNSLFADGAAAVLFTSRKKAKKLKSPMLAVKGFAGEVIHHGATYMTWSPSEQGFLMGLDAMVPQVIEENANRLVTDALRKFGIHKEEILHWAFHPGGKRILSAAAKSLSLPSYDFAHSHRVLRDFGNMSSPTICFVLKSMMQDEVKGKKNEYIFAAGFGPGITIETALFKPVVND
ncbi:MAG: type III polyketide synthase [Chitinophagales bacterium]